MKKIVSGIIGFLFFVECISQDLILNKPADDSASFIYFADPTIFAYNKKFYLYGTVEKNARQGYLVYISSDLSNWKLSDKNNGYALKKEDAFGSNGFWAPQVFQYRGKFYMAYTANENIAIARADHPAGPFTQTDKQALKAPVKQIDPFVFIDDDGKKYLYHVRLINGNRIFVAEMTDDFSSIKEETLKECISATDTWENTNTGWPVAEGPSVIKHGNIYYLFYSANDFRNPNYAVGYATSTSPLGPWTKFAGNPVLSKPMIAQNGTGHGDFFTYRKQLYYVFHTHYNGAKATPRKTALIKAAFEKGNNNTDELRMDKESFYFIRKQSLSVLK